MFKTRFESFLMLSYSDIWKFCYHSTDLCHVSTRLRLCVSVCVCARARVCVCVCVHARVFVHARVCFLYITTVNIFLAQLNLSKQYTPSWAVKRADRETTERKSSQMRERQLLRRFLSKNSPQWRKEGVRDWESRWGERERERWKSQCVVNGALEFQLLLKLATLLNDWVNRREESLFSIKTRG